MYALPLPEMIASMIALPLLKTALRPAQPVRHITRYISVAKQTSSRVVNQGLPLRVVRNDDIGALHLSTDEATPGSKKGIE